MANCCAIALYHCRNFSYFPCFTDLKTPTLTEDESSSLITTILDETERILEKSMVPGILLLFPLRVAGVSARMTSHKARIGKALRSVYTRGFAVSEWVLTDLQEVWDWQENLSVVTT
jgi:hypothetical protein